MRGDVHSGVTYSIHLKSDYRMARCFLKGAIGAELNLTLAAAAWNIKKWINELLWALVLWIERSSRQRDSQHQIKFCSALKAA